MKPHAPGTLASLVALLLVAMAAHCHAQDGSRKLTDVQIDAAAEEIYGMPEFSRFRRQESAPEAESWIERRLSSDGRTAAGPSGASSFAVGLADLARMLIITMAVIAGAVIIGLLIRAIGRHRPATRGAAAGDADVGLRVVAASTPVAARAPGEYLAAAQACHAAGDFRKAIGLVHRAARSSVERAGLVRYRKGLTNGDYLGALRDHPELYSGFREIMRQFEETHYGRRSADEERWRAALGAFGESFGAGAGERP